MKTRKQPDLKLTKNNDHGFKVCKKTFFKKIKKYFKLIFRITWIASHFLS